MSFYIILPFFTFLITFYLLVYIFLQEQKSSVNTACLFLLGIFTLWIFVDIITLLGISEQFFDIFVKIKSALFLSLGFLFLHFTYTLFNRKKDVSYKTSFVTSVLVILVFLTMNLILKDYKEITWNPDVIKGVLYFSSVFICVLLPYIYSTTLILLQLKKIDNKQSLKLIMLTSTISILIIFTFNFIIPIISKFKEANLLASSMTIIFTLSIYNTIRKYDFLSTGISKITHNLFENMLYGFVCCKILVDQNKNPYDYIILDINNAFENLAGLKKENIIGKKITKVFPKIIQLDSDWIDTFGKIALTGEKKQFDQYFEPLKKWFSISVYSPKKYYFAMIVEDVTNRILAEEALRENEKRFKDISFAMADWAWETDEHGVYTYCTKNVKDIVGYSSDEIIGKTSFDLMPLEEAQRINSVFIKLAENKEVIKDLESWNLTKDGKQVCLLSNAIPIFDKKGTFKGYRGVNKDITERKKAEEKLKFLAYHDPLTSLPNRKSFFEHIEEVLILANRSKEEKLRALLFIDIDNFKVVNDSIGHDAGDLLIIQITTRLKECLRKSDYIFRLGGDEFSILANRIAKITDPEIIANKIITTLSKPFYINNNEIYLTICIGISIYPDDGENVDILVKKANTALDHAKKEKNKYCFFSKKMNIKALEKIRLLNYLRYALNKNQFFLEYQPIVNNNLKIVGAEALIRWQHPKIGLISPLQFIPIAEESGLIKPIGEWVLSTACKQITKWIKSGHSDLILSINLSARQFKDKNLLKMVKNICNENKIDLHSLNFEITESCVIEDPEEVIKKMNILCQKGMRFSIDDFGTGYSSLSYITRFPVSNLKIDRAFVKNIPETLDNVILVRGIIMLAHNLNLKVIAEGIEKKEQHTFLKYLNCDEMQGYFYSKPISDTNFLELLKKQKMKNKD